MFTPTITPQGLPHGAGVWTGHFEHKCSSGCFEFDGRVSYGKYSDKNSHIYNTYIAQFNELLHRLLALEGEGKAQIVYLHNAFMEVRLVAYRFTADCFYDEHSQELVQIGSSLGRGVFNLDKTLLLALGDLTPTPFQERELTKADVLMGRGAVSLKLDGARRIIPSDYKGSPEMPMEWPPQIKARRILAVVDISGSMSPFMKEVKRGLDTLALKHEALVVETDMATMKTRPYSKGMKLIYWGTGTDLSKPFKPEFLSEKGPEAIVVFTDGYDETKVEKPKIPVFWCICGSKPAPVSWGTRLAWPPIPSRTPRKACRQRGQIRGRKS